MNSRVWEMNARPEGEAMPIMDQVISDPHYKKEIERSIHVGLLCVQENVNDRPNMSNVMSMFSSDIADLAVPKEPGFNKRHMFMDSSTSQFHQMSGEKITITAITGR